MTIHWNNCMLNDNVRAAKACSLTGPNVGLFEFLEGTVCRKQAAAATLCLVSASNVQSVVKMLPKY